MSVRAKFKVDSVEDNGVVRLSAVTSGSAENESFFDYTPWGNIEMGTVNPEAIKQFAPGMEFYVDFTEAGKDADAQD